MPDGARVDLEALLAHSDWARRLALHLVRDPDRAEDLVQETWRKALERPPAADGSAKGLRGWIGTVLRNLAGTWRRDAALRAWHERRAARPETWTPEDLEQRVLLQRRLAEAVLELAEPYRSAITLRYFVGLSTRAVAERQGVSPDAARQRISRGLSMLHRTLDREFRDGDVAWSAIATLAFEGTRQAWLASSMKGGLLLSSRSKLVVAAAALVAISAVFIIREYWNDRTGIATGSSTSTQLASSELDSQTPKISPSTAESSVPSKPERTALESENSALNGSGPSDRDRVLAGRVVDPSGNPVEGARITVLRNEMAEYKFLDTAHQFDGRSIAETRSDANGDFSVPVETGRPYLLEAEARGFSRQRLERRYAGERVLVRLYRGAAIQGMVSRKLDHSPVVNASIKGYSGSKQGPRDRYSPFQGKTDALGRFEFDGIRAGEIYLRVTPEEDAEPEMKLVELIEDTIQEVNVEVEPGQTVRGRVVDVRTGQPIAGAEVGVGRDLGRPIHTDANGDFVYRGFPSRLFNELDARAPGYGKVEKFLRAESAESAADRVDFELSPERLVRGRIVDEHGNPVSAAYVVAASYSHVPRGTYDKTDWQSSVSSADGSFRIQSVRADMTHAFLARKDGLGTVSYDFPADESSRTEIDLGDVVLPPMSILRGSVVDEGGNGIPDQTVSLRGWNSDRARFREAEGRRVSSHDTDDVVQIYLGVREARTDDLGRFSFADVAEGTYTVSTERRGGSPVSQQAWIQRGTTRDGIRLVQPEGKSIEGRVTTYEGAPVSHALVLALPEDMGIQGRSSTETDTEGRFALRGLASVPYWLNAQPSYWSGGSKNDAELASTETSGVIPGTRGLEIVLGRLSPIRGRVVDLDGRSLPQAKIRFGTSGGTLRQISETSEDGGFAIPIGAGVVVDLEAIAGDSTRPSIIPSYPANDTEHVARMSKVAAGSVDIVFRLARYP